MANIFQFPFLNPLRSFWQSDNLPSNSGTQYLQAFNPAFNFKHFDVDLWGRLLKYYESKNNYMQPFQQSDTIRLQWLGSDGTSGHYQARLLTPTGNEYTPKSVTVVQEAGTYGGLYLYTITMKLYDLAEGIYFMQVRHNGGSGNQYVLFEPFHCKQIHENTIRIDYTSSFNDQAVIYPSTAFIYQLRFHGCLAEMTPGSKFNVYEDQPLNVEMVSGIAFRSFELFVGLATMGVPEWLADKLERITLVETTNYDGKQFTREQGSKLEPKNVPGQPLSTYTLKLRERENNTTYDIYGATNIIGAMPQTNYFWIEDISIGTTVNMRKMFKGKRNFLDYLNSTYLLTYGYWAEDSNNKLVFINTSGAALAGTYTLTAANTLAYGIKIVYTGTGDVDIDLSGPVGNHYAIAYSDGSASVNKTTLATHPAVTNITKTFAANTTREVYIFLTNGTAISDTASTIYAKSIGGDLPPGMIYFIPCMVGAGVTEIENNIFQYVTAMVDFSINSNSFGTFALNDLVRWIGGDTLTQWSTSANIDISSQSPTTSPSKTDPGIARLLAAITNRVTTFAYD